MGTVAGRGRWEKPGTTRRRVVPLETWPERRWRRLEREFGVTKPDATVREALRNVVTLYERALGTELSNKEIRDGVRRLVAVAGMAAADGLQLGFPPTKQAALLRALVEIFLGDVLAIVGIDDLTRQLLEPELLALLVKRLARGAWCFRSGAPMDFALMEFVSRLDRLSAAVCGVPLTLSVYPNLSAADAVSVRYEGTLLEVVKLVQPALPRVAGSIAECSTSTLGARLQAARTARRQPHVPPIP
jgi:hypothetical protein